jgi:opacity protein-like surface antigen
MRTLKLTTLALALAGAFPASAADAAPDTTKELQALKARVADLEKALKAAPSGLNVVPAKGEIGGMTPDQEAEFNRIKIKAEALEDGRDASGFKGFKISGYMDPVYIYNANKQRNTVQFVVPVVKDPYGYDNSYFGTVALDVQKETDNGTKFHVTLIPQRSAGEVQGDLSILHEATVWIPLGGLDTKLFAGQLPDWSGYEYLAPTQNKVITHNLLFDFTLPSAYTGVGLELVRGKWDLKFMLANMNASIRNIGEHVPMLVFRGDYTGGEFWGFGFAGAEGYKSNLRGGTPNTVLDPDGSLGILYSTKDTRYDTLELDGWYTRGDLTLNTHVTFGQQQKASITENLDTGDLRTAQWMGISVLAAEKFTPRVEGILRADFLYNQKNGGGLLDYTSFDASNGIGPAPFGTNPNKGANRYALTAGMSYALNENVVLKGEYRFDGATQAVFGNNTAALTDPFTANTTDGKYRKYNSLVATSVVFSF